MKQILLITLILAFAGSTYCQEEDWSWWNEIHDWHTGDPGWRNYLTISSGYLGPNALPVPEIKNGLIERKTELELTASSHFNSGDPTQDISGKAFVPFCDNKIAIEVYGVIAEHFAYTEEIRDERCSRDKNGKGFSVGDLYFCTLIQIAKNRKFPNTLLRVGLRTASGGRYDAARYSDAPGYFLDLSFSKEYGDAQSLLFRPHMMLGFYCWQTNDELNLQNDAFLYGAGLNLIKNSWQFTPSWSGYYGYKNNGDRPMLFNIDLRKDYEKKAIRVQYEQGLHDWMYKTVRFSFIWKFNVGI